MPGNKKAAIYQFYSILLCKLMTWLCGHSPGLISQAKHSQFWGPGNAWARLRMGSEGKVFLGWWRWEKSCLMSVTMVEWFPWHGQWWREEEPAGLLTSILGTGSNFNCHQCSPGCHLAWSVSSQQEEGITLPATTYQIQNFFRVAFWLEATATDVLV